MKKENGQVTKQDVIRGTAFATGFSEKAIADFFDLLSSVKQNGIPTWQLHEYLMRTYNIYADKAEIIVENWKCLV